MMARTRIASPDPFNGLRGHDYIRARGLAPKVDMKGLPAPIAECQCQRCVQERLLPAVMRLCAPNDRRQPSHLQDIPWNDLANDAVFGLLDTPTEAGA